MIHQQDSGSDRHVFADGNMSQVVREGNSVFRVIAPWADAAHQVLRHLEHGGYLFSPRLKGLGNDREELSFVPGDSIPADLAGCEDEALLEQLGGLIRQFHTAMHGFEFAPGTAYVRMQHAPAAPSIVCHSDIGPWNIIILDGEITGLIDWDLVAPATPEWDLAYAAWRFAPLYPQGRTGFRPNEQARRIRVLLDAYGLPTARREGFVDQILQRMRSAVDTVEILGKQRVEGFSSLYDNGLHLSGIDDMKWLTRHRAELVGIIE